MNPPGTTPEQPVRLTRALAPTEHCDLCGEPCPADPDIEAASGLTICSLCLEDML